MELLYEFINCDLDVYKICPDKFDICRYSQISGIKIYTYYVTTLPDTYYQRVAGLWYQSVDDYFERITTKTGYFQNCHEEYQSRVVFDYWILKQYMQKNRYPSDLIQLIVW